MKLPIPQDWDEESWCCYAIEWPNSEAWTAILRGFITLPARGRTWDERMGSVLDVQAIGREISRRNLPEKDCLMACSEDTAQALQAIATALENMNLGSGSSCCDNQGSRGAPPSEPPYSENEEGNPNTDPPPEGYDSWEEFFNQKCFIAKDIVNKLQQDLGELAITNFGNMSLSALAALIALAFATPIPFDDIIAIAGLLLATAAEIVIATTLSILNDNEEELVCELYNGQSAIDSRTRFLSRFNDSVDSGVAEPITAFTVKAIMKYMLSSSAVNRLYVKDNTLVFPSDDCDCQQCEELQWTFDEGELEGWAASTAMPECFGLSDPVMASIAVVDQKLLVTLGNDETNKTGAIRVTGIEFDVSDNWQLLVRLQRIGGTSLYFDVVYILEDDTCLWQTVSNDITLSTFHDETNSTPDAIGHTIVEMHFYFSSNPGAESQQVNIEHIYLQCEPA